MNRVFLVKSHPQFTRGASVVRKRGRRSITSKHPTLAGPGMAYPHQGTNSAALGSEPGQPASPVTARHCTRNSAVSLAPCFLTSAEHFKFSSNEKEFIFFSGQPQMYFICPELLVRLPADSRNLLLCKYTASMTQRLYLWSIFLGYICLPSHYE